MRKNNTGKIATLLFSITLAACTNLKIGNLTTASNPSVVSSTSNVFTHSVQNVNIATLTTGSPPDLKLSLAVAPGALPLTQYCEVGTSSTRPCACVLTWTEINNVSGTPISVPRVKKLAVLEVQTGLVKCQMTQLFWNEIPAGTVMYMNIEPVSPNASGLNCQKIGFKKGTSFSPTGDFVDDTLTPFRNIHRYTCYSKRTSSHEVLSGYVEGTTTNSSGISTSVNVIMGSRFCSEPGSNCQSPRNGFSAQSYYRNLFVRSDKIGEINSSNARYDCPKVFESISYKATNPPTVPSGEQNRFWPLDSTFAVATVSSNEWSVPIPAASVLMKSGDVNAVDDSGIQATDRLKELGTTNGSIAWKILGYGKKPNSNGTCGSIVDSIGQIRPLTRLRRYRVVYPGSFQNSGKYLEERLEADQVYVADRLVSDTNGNLTGNMVYGPKPCNFAWFDHEGVTRRLVLPSGTQAFGTNFANAVPTYQATSNYYYPGMFGDIPVNPDGLVLPNLDRDGAIGGLLAPSCSATISIYDELMGVPGRARLLTSYFNRSDSISLGNRTLYLNEIHVSPVERWVPEYVEDTSFQACVPISTNYIEPPLHFYREPLANGGNVAWCAKAYPTQNSFWLDLNSRKKPLAASVSAQAVNWDVLGGSTNSAQVAWYTSHVNSGAGLDTYNINPVCTSTAPDKICEFSLGSTGAPDYANCVTYLQNHLTTQGTLNNRCDRTVVFDPFQAYRGFPLQAKDDDIRTMLKNDMTKNRNFGCYYSVHANPALVNQNQPLTNCCGVIAGTPILDFVTNKLDFDTLPDRGHLEPFVNPLFPNVRYCGNPVE